MKRGSRVVDLGAAPGGWTQIAAQRIGAEAGPGKEGPSKEGRGKLVAADILPMEPVAGAIVLQLDFLAEDAPAKIIAALGGPADIVFSDMAAPTPGHGPTDHLRIVALAETAYVFAKEVLAPGGAFVAKVFQGGAEGALLAGLKRDFTAVRHAKPPASRAESAEVYVVATGFRAANRTP